MSWYRFRIERLVDMRWELLDENTPSQFFDEAQARKAFDNLLATQKLSKAGETVRLVEVHEFYPTVA